MGLPADVGEYGLGDGVANHDLWLQQQTAIFNEQAAEHLVLGVYSPSLTETIRVDDTVAAGVMVALHGDPGGDYRLEVLPRIYRKVCQNGMVIYRGKARSHEVEPEVLEDQWAPDRLVAAIKRQIAACLARTELSVERWSAPGGSELLEHEKPRRE